VEGRTVSGVPFELAPSVPSGHSDTHVSMWHTSVMNAKPVYVGAKGRVVLPASIRHALGLVEGTELLARVEEGAVVLEPRVAAIGRLQALVRASVGQRASLADDLISERRAEARRQKKR